MSEFLGSRISLISKSDIRYSGILHEINSEESTVSLENVKSFGTEGRKGNPDEEIAPSDQVYEYIVFRGSDVKDLRIDAAPAAPKENKPPVPDDPAIVGARARPAGNAAPGPSNQQGPPQGPPGGPGFGQPPYPPNPNFYPPGPGAPWGRGGPGPGPGFGGMPYPPPPGWFPPGQGFPPGAPGPWNQFGYPPGPPGPSGPQAQGGRGTPQQDNSKPMPIGGAGPDKPKQSSTPSHAELSAEPKSLGQPPNQSAPTLPVDSKPSAAEVQATAESLAAGGPSKGSAQNKSVPTGPKNSRVTPAIPLPPTFPLKTQTTAAAAMAQPAIPTQAALKDATEAARAAVAVAMANLPTANGGPSNVPDAAINAEIANNLSRRMGDMGVAPRGNSGRGRGRGGRGGAAKIEVPDADFDFQTSNAKFSKQELVKEAVTSSPLAETPNGAAPEAQPTPEANAAQAYNKKTSFFDNIGSESKDRAENNGQKAGGREWRGEEMRKNMETFGQGSVDGPRGYRGRGRGRGNSRGGRGYGRGRGGGGGNRRDDQAIAQ